VVVGPGQELENAAVLVERGVIVAVGIGLEPPPDARVLEGAVVCAGFVNPWSELGVDPESVTDLGTGPATRASDGVDPWTDVELRREALRGGVTAVRVQASAAAPWTGIGTVVRNLPDAIRVRLADGIVQQEACMGATVGVTRQNSVPDVFDRIEEVDRLVSTLEKAKAYREQQIEYRYELEEWQKAIAEKEKELEKDFKKAKKDREKEMKEAEEKDKEFKESRYKEDKKPRQPKYDADSEALARVVDGTLPLVVEAHRAAEIRYLLEKLHPYDRLRLVLAGATEAVACADTLAERGVPVIVWPTPMGLERSDEYVEHDLSLAAALAEHGVEVLIGTGGSRDTRDLRLLAALAVGHGLDPEAAFSAITKRPAEVFDLRGKLGTLERGNDADVLVLDGDPLQTATQVRYVVARGEVVMEP